MKNEQFEIYFRQNKNLILRLVLDKTGDYQAAQEITQQVFFQLYLNMEKIQPEMVKAWLVRCTRNAVVDYLRHTEIHNAMFTETSVAEEGNLLIEETLEIHEEKRQRAELSERILKEVRAANENWYEVLVMICIDGMSYPEIAKELNMSIDALRARVYRARCFIRERFGEEYQDMFED